MYANIEQGGKPEGEGTVFLLNNRGITSAIPERIGIHFHISSPSLRIAVSCEVKYIDNSLKNYLSPAFYLTPPIDQYTENVIYLNPAENCRGLSLYTTLAH